MTLEEAQREFMLDVEDEEEHVRSHSQDTDDGLPHGSAQ